MNTTAPNRPRLLARLAAWCVLAWPAVIAWRNPADAAEGLSDGQYQVLSLLFRIVGYLLIAALLVLLVYVKARSAVAGAL